MHKIISLILIFGLSCVSLGQANDHYCYNGNGKYHNETYDYKQSQRLGKTWQDSSNTAINLSMLGWGIGLAAGIAILSAIVHQSKGATTNNPTNASSSLRHPANHP